MFDFNASAWRQASDAARPTRMDAANDLVTRTLACHGLSSGLPGAGDVPANGPPLELRSGQGPLAELMARFQTGGASVAADAPKGPASTRPTTPAPPGRAAI